MEFYIVPYIFRLILAFAISGILKAAMEGAIRSNYSMMILEREERDHQLDLLDKLFGLVTLFIFFMMP